MVSSFYEHYMNSPKTGTMCVQEIKSWILVDDCKELFWSCVRSIEYLEGKFQVKKYSFLTTFINKLK